MSVQTILDKIKNGVYGKDVRQAIHDGILKVYEDTDGSIKLSNEANEALYTKVLSTTTKLHNEALNTASLAVDISKANDEYLKNIQTQVNDITVSGDSSPQATQASVGADGTSYGGNLKARLDSEFNATASQLADIPTLSNTLNQSKTVKYIAHRGLSLIAPENTLPAYELAGKARFWGAECDIIPTSNGFWVLMHDKTLDRTTNGVGDVRGFTLAEVKALNVDAGNGIALYQSLKVPTLEEFLQTCKLYGMVPIIELKYVRNNADYELLVEEIKRLGFEESCMILCFDLLALQEIRKHSNKIILQLLADITAQSIEDAKALKNSCIGLSSEVITKEKVELAHANGLPVNVYTVNNYQDAKTFIKYGADYISTDIIGGVL